MCLLLAVQALSKSSRKWHVCTILYAYTRKGSFCLKKNAFLHGSQGVGFGSWCSDGLQALLTCKRVPKRA